MEAQKEKLLEHDQAAAGLFSQVIEQDPFNDAAMYEIAMIYMKERNYKDAILMVKKATDIDPDNNWYQLLLGELYMQTGKYGPAAEIYEKLVRKDPENIDYYENWTRSLIYEGKYNEAMKAYDQLERIIGIDEQIILQKQKIYLHLNKFDKAEAEVKRLIERYPAESRYLAILAEMYMANDMKDKAFQVYNQILQIDPDNAFIHISLADYYRRTGDKAGSFEELKKGFANPYLDIDTKIQIVLSYYAVTEVYTELKDQAFALIEMLMQAHPKDPKSYSMYADFLLRENKLQEAREQFRYVVSLDSSRYLIWEQLLRLDADLNDFASMKTDGRRAIGLFPEQPLPYLLCGASVFQAKEYEEAIRLFKRGVYFVVDNNPLLIQFYSYLGDAFNQVKNHKESDEAYEKVLSLDAENAYVLNNYSYYLSLRKENLGKAEVMAKKANGITPDNASYQDTYGWVLYESGKYEDAKIWLYKALENGGDSNAVILEHYGDVLYKLGKPDEATVYWERAKKAGGGSEFLPRKINDGKLYE